MLPDIPLTTATTLDEWRDTLADAHGAMDIAVPTPEGPWTPRTWRHSTRRTASYALTGGGGGQETLARRPGHIRADARGRHKLMVFLAGGAVIEQSGTYHQLRAGQMALCDMDQPLRIAHDETLRALIFTMPTQDIATRSRTLGRHGHLLESATGLGRIVRSIVTTLHEERDHLSDAAFDLTANHLLDLVCLAAQGDTATAPDGQRGRVEAEIRQYVRRHVTSAGLDATVIARDLGWSARYVQQVMREAGTTPRDLIRRERLLLARSRLASREWSGVPIARIAHSCGFGSHATFTNAFRAEFGLSPREARH